MAEERVPIAERGGRMFPRGTVYYSKSQNAFLRAGFEDRGPLALDEVSGRVSWEVTRTGRARFRDETGVFIPLKTFQLSGGLTFQHHFITIEETLVDRVVRGMEPERGAQFVERITLIGLDGKVHVVEVPHGIDKPYDEGKQRGHFWRKAVGALFEPGASPQYEEVMAAISTKVVIERRPSIE